MGKIALDEPSAIGKVPKPRSVAVALLFGPDGDLFVPITNAFPPGTDPGKDTGAIRRYRTGCRPSASDKCFSNFCKVRPATWPGLVPVLRQDQSSHPRLWRLTNSDPA